MSFRRARRAMGTMAVPFNPQSGDAVPSTSSWLTNNNIFTRLMGFSMFASMFTGVPGASAQGGGYIWDSLRLFLLGLIIEMGRRASQWLLERIQLSYSITAEFTEGDPAYEWLVLFLNDAQIWKSSRDFRVSAKSSSRKWGVKASPSSSGTRSTVKLSFIRRALDALASFHIPLFGDTAIIASANVDEKANIVKIESSGKKEPHAEYVPTYEAPQIFRWKGYWVEIKRQHGKAYTYHPMMGNQPAAVIYLTIYTHDMDVLYDFVEEARDGYVKTSLPNVVVHTADQGSFGPHFMWNNAKSKARRPLSSIILQEGVINSLIADAREFLESEDWYRTAGIPHRRGYLLHGPPGTGKTSTIYAIAGELGLEIYSLSLASNFVDDSFLQRAVQAVPKNAIILIEDIDCAFPIPREDGGDDDDDDTYDTHANNPMMAYNMGMMKRGMYGMPVPGVGGGGKVRSLVTLSGLLNVLDGVSSEEGKLFFATTNHIDHLDAALLRPGRVDRKVQYWLATQAQAEALFLRFYSQAVYDCEVEQLGLESSSSTITDKEKQEPLPTLAELASTFALSVPTHEFSTAELQGFLLSCKQSPFTASRTAASWIDSEIKEREAKKSREAAKAKKANEKREEREERKLRSGLARIGVEAGGSGGMGGMQARGMGIPMGQGPMRMPKMGAAGSRASEETVKQASENLAPTIPIDAESALLPDPTQPISSSSGTPSSTHSSSTDSMILVDKPVSKAGGKDDSDDA